MYIIINELGYPDGVLVANWLNFLKLSHNDYVLLKFLDVNRLLHAKFTPLRTSSPLLPLLSLITV